MSDAAFAAPEAPGSSTTPLSAPKAGFWMRFGASFLDGFVVAIAATALRLLLGDVGALLGLVVSIGYYTYFEGSSGQTPGKRSFGLCVVDVTTGEPIGYSRAFLRWIGRLVSTIPILLGYFWMLWDGRKQCWHDKIANDLVVRIAQV